MKSESGRRLVLLATGTAVMVAAAFPAWAYVGPGAGLTLLGALWGLVLAVVMSIGFVILWPFRRLMRRRKRRAAPQNGDTADQVADDAENTILANRTDRREDG
ncbi:MAG TPA: hypothetical protein VLB05_01850 [Dongiaceae bacterium]|jgi:membrane protein implicated in regulation of membrane protease activity|nr:hypothetical protein [Dongiaceae bacterium]